MLFVEAIEGGVIPKAAALTCGGGAFSFGDALLCDSESFGEDVAINRGSCQPPEDAIDLRGADVERFGNTGQREIGKEIFVDIMDDFRR